MRQQKLPMSASRRGSMRVRAGIGWALLWVGAAGAEAATSISVEPLVALAIAASSSPSPGSSAGEPDAIDSYTIDGGGGRSSGGIFTLEGTIGQTDADPLQPSSGGIYEISGGFWPGLAPAAPRPDSVFADGFE